MGGHGWSVRPLLVSLLLVAMPGALSCFLLLVVRPGAPSSVHAWSFKSQWWRSGCSLLGGWQKHAKTFLLALFFHSFFSSAGSRVWKVFFVSPQQESIADQEGGLVSLGI